MTPGRTGGCDNGADVNPSHLSPSFPTRRLRVSLSVHCGSTPGSVTIILPYSFCQYIMRTCSKRTTPPLALGETIGAIGAIGVAAALNYARKVVAIGARPPEDTQ